MNTGPPHKKYILFQYDVYYPGGGLKDVVGSFDTIEEAREYAQKERSDFNEIVDRDTWEIIEDVGYWQKEGGGSNV